LVFILQLNKMIFSFVDVGQGRTAELWQHFNNRSCWTAEGEHKTGKEAFISADIFLKAFLQIFYLILKRIIIERKRKETKRKEKKKKKKLHCPLSRL